MSVSRHNGDVRTPASEGLCARWPDNADIIKDVLERVGDKWSVLVIGLLRDGPMRYRDLHHGIPGISQRMLMLMLTLRQLQRDGLITRTAYAEAPPRVEYALTTLGATLLDTVLALVDWAASHHIEIRDHRVRFDANEK